MVTVAVVGDPLADGGGRFSPISAMEGDNGYRFVLPPPSPDRRVPYSSRTCDGKLGGPPPSPPTSPSTALRDFDIYIVFFLLHHPTTATTTTTPVYLVGEDQRATAGLLRRNSLCPPLSGEAEEESYLRRLRQWHTVAMNFSESSLVSSKMSSRLSLWRARSPRYL